MSKRGAFVLLLVFGLVLAALAERRGDLALLALPLVAYLTVGAWLAPQPAGVQLNAGRTLGQRFAQGDHPVEVKVVVANTGGPLDNLRLAEDTPARGARIDGALVCRAALRPGDTAELGYRVRAPRGRYRWAIVQAEAADPFDLFPVQLELPTPGELLVGPRVPRLRVAPLSVRQTIHSAGPVAARLAGPGVDFWGTREYHPGDSLRWLAWRRLAREPGKLYTKEFEKHEIADVGLILDARQLTDLAGPGETLFEYSVQAAAGLAEAYLHAGNRVSLLVFGDVLLRAFPGYGKAHLQRILACLAGASTGANISIDTLKYLPVRLFPSRSQIIFISPLAPGDAGAIAWLRAFGYSVLLVSPDPVEYAARCVPRDEGGELALRAARVERALLLRRTGVPAVSWRVDEPLNTAIHKALAHPGRRCSNLAGQAR